MSLEFRGLEEAEAELRKMAATMDSKVDGFAREAARFFEHEVRARVPVRTGRLRDSIRLRKEGVGYYVVETTAPYAGYVEYGSTPHIIEPTSASVLRFSLEGREIYARRVRHPGSSPRPYWRPALAETCKAASKMLLEAFRG